MILIFGILSIALMGPLLGIPAWIMGHKDLRKIRAGALAASHHNTTQAGMVLGIIGKFISPFTFVVAGIAIAVGLSMFTAQSVGANRDAIISDLTNLAAHAHEYRMRPSSMDGGGGSYSGYSIPHGLRSNENGKYQLLRVTDDNVTFKGTSRRGYGTVTATYGPDGLLMGSLKFTGDFDEDAAPESPPEEVESRPYAAY